MKQNPAGREIFETPRAGARPLVPFDPPGRFLL